jgi:transposase
MPLLLTSFPPLPADTARAAEAMFGKGNFYLTVGDGVGDLFANLDLTDLGGDAETPAYLLALFSLVTIFQYMEDLPDRQAAEAIRARIDWRYALHLPLDFPGFPHTALCEFRRRLLFSTAARQVFQCLMTHLADLNLPVSKDFWSVDASSVLAAVCTVNRVERISEAMRQALEALAAWQPEWLRTIALPHWYDRYRRARAALPRSKEEQGLLAQAIGSDILYLIGSVAISHLSASSLPPEVRAIQQLWHRQFEPYGDSFKWRLMGCDSCGMLNQELDPLPAGS